MQRLFSTFPDGWPGRALLLLRLVTAAPLLRLWVAFISASIIPRSRNRTARTRIRGLLALGFCTPLAALLSVALKGWLAFHAGSLFEEHSLLAVIGISLAMLGPVRGR